MQTDDIDLRGAHILVVDDDPDNREVLAIVLQDSGASVAQAESAEQALAAYQEQRPHLVITDIGLPDHDGFDLLRQLRALPAGERGHVPAIALTGYSAPPDTARANEARFQAHLTKPVDLPDVLRVVARVLRQAREPH
jgi:CheY-like chemotaxis protein